MNNHWFSTRHFFYGKLFAGPATAPFSPALSDFAVATKYIEWVSLGAIALRVPGKLMWNPNKRRFSNRGEANKLVKPFLRMGWDLKV